MIHSMHVNGEDGKFMRADDWLSNGDQPVHCKLCAREQAFMLRPIMVDLARHNKHAGRSVEIVPTSDRSARKMRAMDL